MSSTEQDEEVKGVAKFLIALESKFGVKNDAPFSSNNLKVDMNAAFRVPLIPLLTTDVSHAKTTSH